MDQHKETLDLLLKDIRGKIWWLTERYQEEIQKQLYAGNQPPDIVLLKKIHSKICGQMHSYNLVLTAISKVFGEVLDGES
jgi:hypothetical protein